MQFISKELKVLWQVSTLKCALHDNYISYFIEIPLYTSTYETLFLLSHPYKDDNNVFTVLAHPAVILRQVNDLYISKECKLIKNNYYCNNIKRIENNTCVEKILKNKDNQCNKIKLRHNENFIKYVSIINKYLVVNQNNIIVNMNNQTNVTMVNKYCYLLQLENNEYIIGKLKPRIFWESNLLDIISLNTNNPINKIKVTFEELHTLNILSKPLEILSPVIMDKTHTIVLYILFVIIITIAIIYCIFLNRNTFTKFKKVSEPTEVGIKIVLPTAPTLNPRRGRLNLEEGGVTHI